MEPHDACRYVAEVTITVPSAGLQEHVCIMSIVVLGILTGGTHPQDRHAAQ